ncbi:hypothetical protein S1361_26925 [Streptomyces cyanogenus]|uniref:Uncharacterized protein n=1 Tax=Streptomyces cyanogenus TaxID=80860 RepID=A0ABX7U235_STRCY|nr:hypothetical protein S1361_26925 [Streptomyces cyanogenus]
MYAPLMSLSLHPPQQHSNFTTPHTPASNPTLPGLPHEKELL